ncbi:MAG: DUF4332 domain-containing protein [Acidobacteria bacterium]|nr:DUF4332 domain-containing protein [Acidobacteriota bacterium]
MKYRIQAIDGIGPAHASVLKEAGITTTSSLLKSCANPKGREALSWRTSISTHLLLKWANSADLMRIPGIGRHFAELLEAAGVDTVKELKNRLPENLAAKLAAINASKRLCRVTPSQALVAKWIAQAQVLEPAIFY